MHDVRIHCLCWGGKKGTESEFVTVIEKFLLLVEYDEAALRDWIWDELGEFLPR